MNNTRQILVDIEKQLTKIISGFEGESPKGSTQRSVYDLWDTVYEYIVECDMIESNKEDK